MEAFLESLSEMTYGPALVGAVLVVLVLEIVALRATGRASPRARRWQIAAGVATLLLIAFFATSLHAARATMESALAPGDPSERATAFSRGISGQLNVIPFASATFVLLSAVWLVATLWSGRRPIPRVAFVGFGLFAVAIGALQWSTHVIKTVAGLAGIDPALKGGLLLDSLDFARPHFALFLRVSRWTIAGMVGVAAVLVVDDTRQRRAAFDPVADARATRATLGAALAALIAAAVLVVAARPMRAENDVPWPAMGSGEGLVTAEPSFQDLDGPDAVERAPVVQVFADRLLLDGAERGDDELESMLVTLRNNFALLHPGEKFNGTTVVVAGPDAPMPRVARVLGAAHDALCPRPLLTFTRPETTLRPTFGKLERVHATAARLTLVRPDDDADAYGDEPAETRVVLRLADFPRYDAFARRVVDLRRLGKGVVVDLGK